MRRLGGPAAAGPGAAGQVLQLQRQLQLQLPSPAVSPGCASSNTNSPPGCTWRPIASTQPRCLTWVRQLQHEQPPRVHVAAHRLHPAPLSHLGAPAPTRTAPPGARGGPSPPWLPWPPGCPACVRRFLTNTCPCPRADCPAAQAAAAAGAAWGPGRRRGPDLSRRPRGGAGGRPAVGTPPDPAARRSAAAGAGAPHLQAEVHHVAAAEVQLHARGRCLLPRILQHGVVQVQGSHPPALLGQALGQQDAVPRRATPAGSRRCPPPLGLLPVRQQCAAAAVARRGRPLAPGPPPARTRSRARAGACRRRHASCTPAPGT